VDEAAAEHTIAFVRRGFFLKEVGHERIAADATQAVFFPRGETYRVHHPIEGGDDCVVLALDDDFLDEAERDLGGDAYGEPRLPSGHVRLDTRLSMLLSQLFARATRGVDAVAIEETACRLASAVLETARAGRGAWQSATADRRERVAAVQSTMTSRLGERLLVSGLAATVGWSQFQLLRAFREDTGMPVHRYLTNLRVAAALARLSDGETDLTRVALDCGFSDHSHFSNVFRERAALTPSAARVLINRPLG
jgi:AraC-like DNA-binding protein